MTTSIQGDIKFLIKYINTPDVTSVNLRTDNSAIYYSQIARAKNNEYLTIPSSSQCDWFAIEY